jgi:hypothetical protein
MGKDQVAPSIGRHQSVRSGQVDAQLPFNGTYVFS